MRFSYNKSLRNNENRKKDKEIDYETKDWKMHNISHESRLVSYYNLYVYDSHITMIFLN